MSIPFEDLPKEEQEELTKEDPEVKAKRVEIEKEIEALAMKLRYDDKDQTIAALAEENRRLREDNGILQANNKNLRGEISGYKADFGNTEAQTIADLRAQLAELKEKNEEWEQTFDLTYEADVRGIEMFREAHPEYAEQLKMPSTDKLICWLLEQLAAKEAELDLYRKAVEPVKNALRFIDEDDGIDSASLVAETLIVGCREAVRRLGGGAVTATLTPRISTNRTPLQDVIPLATPYLVFLDPSDLCNFRCRFCPTGDRELVKRYRKPAMMKWEVYAKIIRDLAVMPAPVKVLRLYKDGEPLLNPLLPRMVRYAKETGRFLQIDTTTNGSLLNYRLSCELIEAGLDKLFVSVEGMGAEAYREFCGYRLDWKRFVAGIEEFYWLSRDRCGLHVKIAGDYLTDAQREEFVQTFGEIADEIFVEHTAPCWPGFEVREANREVGIYGNRLGKVNVCPYIFYSTAINSDGTVSLCFLDWQHKMLIGDLKKQSFKEIWNGEEHKRYQRLMLEGRRGEIPFCRNCGQLTHGMPDDIDRYAEELRGRIA